jgi:hypothetical protein
MLFLLWDFGGSGRDDVENFCSTWNFFEFWMGQSGRRTELFHVEQLVQRSGQKVTLVMETEQNDDRHDDGTEENFDDLIVEDLLVGV